MKITFKFILVQLLVLLNQSIQDQEPISWDCLYPAGPTSCSSLFPLFAPGPDCHCQAGASSWSGCSVKATLESPWGSVEKLFPLGHPRDSPEETVPPRYPNDFSQLLRLLKAKVLAHPELDNCHLTRFLKTLCYSEVVVWSSDIT